jgi:hypothetical protein
MPGGCRKCDMIRWKSVEPYYYNPILALYDTPLKPKRRSDVNISVFELEIPLNEKVSGLSKFVRHLIDQN